MKTKVITYTLLTSGLAAVAWLLANASTDVDVGALFGWATAAGLVAMAPLDYRLAWKHIADR